MDTKTPTTPSLPTTPLLTPRYSVEDQPVNFLAERDISSLIGGQTGLIVGHKVLMFRSFSQRLARLPASVPDMELKTVVKKLNSIAPTTLAGSWDNVGLLVEPTPPHQVKTMLLTNDLTENVLKEAMEKNVNLILSYHPPIFSPLKRLTQRTWKERIVVQCIERRIAVYAPHTSYDAVQGGVNDWLLKPFSGASKPIEKVTSKQFPTAGGFRLELTFDPNTEGISSTSMVGHYTGIPGVSVNSATKVGEESQEQVRLCLNCTESGLTRAMDDISTRSDRVKQSVEILQLVKPPIPHHGPGRIMSLDCVLKVSDVIEKVKSHLQLSHVRLANAVNTGLDSPVASIAVCAGSGSSVLRGVEADLYLTGEMSHHEVLDANHRGSTVILCDHSNTERGFLKDHKAQLETLFEEKVAVYMSETDRDPLEIV